jgi:hypothetical protein
VVFLLQVVAYLHLVMVYLPPVVVYPFLVGVFLFPEEACLRPVLVFHQID